MIDEGHWNAGEERWDVLIANQWSLIYQPHGYIQKVSACRSSREAGTAPPYSEAIEMQKLVGIDLY